MSTFIYQYRCRKCGNVFDGSQGSENLVGISLAELIVTGKVKDPMGPSMAVVHSSCGTGLGIGDLIGTRKLWDDKPKADEEGDGVMTVKKLIAALQSMDPDRIIIMSSDSEGNCYSPLADLSTGTYYPDSTSMGEVKYGVVPEEGEEGEKAVILGPVR